MNLDNLSAEQKKKLAKLMKLTNLVDKGTISILSYFVDLEDKYDKALNEEKDKYSELLKSEKALIEQALNNEKENLKKELIDNLPIRGEDYMNDDDIAYFESYLSSLVKNIDEEELLKKLSSKIKNIDEEKLYKSIIREVKSQVESIVKQIKNGEDGKDGKDAFIDYDLIIKNLKDKIQEDKEIKGLTNVSPQEIRDLLELLQEDERFDAKSIKGLPELIKKLNPTVGPMLHTPSLFNLPDVDLAGIQSNQFIKWDGNKFVAGNDSGLTEVTHNSTLVGKGTIIDPLGINESLVIAYAIAL